MANLTHSVALGRATPRLVTTERALFTYNQWMLQRVQDAIAQTPHEQAAVAAMLDACGATALANLVLTTRLERRQFRLLRAAN